MSPSSPQFRLLPQKTECRARSFSSTSVAQQPPLMQGLLLELWPPPRGLELPLLIFFSRCFWGQPSAQHMVRGNPSKRVGKGGGKLVRVHLPTSYLQVLPPSSANDTYGLGHHANELDHPVLFRVGRANLQCFLLLVMSPPTS